MTPPKAEKVSEQWLGKKAPDLKVIIDGKETALSKLWKNQHLVLYFYPKDHTPGCSQEAQDFQKHLPEITDLNATVLGVSRDSESSHQSFKDTYQLTFPLIADTSHKLCEAYNVWQEKKMFKKVYMGIVRYTFCIQKGGTIKHVWAKVRVKGHVQEVVAALKEL
ncbi:MAG: peroxiredoxin [Proteobacteria bacterium]|nr:peroxiredoxin [Pseudomonadota bacterium]